MIAEGKKAPPFTLKDQNDKSVRLDDFAGRWVVLYFYPKDDTPGCTTEACEFTSILQQFEGLDADVIGCSPDDADSHRKFIAKHRLRVRLLSDPDHKVMAKYGAWGMKNMYGKKVEGVIRSTVIIDPEGQIMKRWGAVKAAGHAERVREVLGQLAAN
ncbi:MAG TPA: peroxiredoxin [Planctomycetota bacterium]|jgi:peroxiredoxin Q/BCP|nr:peroxiredoxin [Planctomycetota bacterium]